MFRPLLRIVLIPAFGKEVTRKEIERERKRRRDREREEERERKRGRGRERELLGGKDQESIE